MERELNPLLAKEIERLNFKLAEVEFQRDNLASEINRLKEDNEELKRFIFSEGYDANLILLASNNSKNKH